MKTRTGTALLLVAAITLCGCSGGQHAADLTSANNKATGTTHANTEEFSLETAYDDEAALNSASDKWGDLKINDTDDYYDMYEKGAVSGQLYENERYRFKLNFPESFKLYDYASFAEILKSKSNMSDEDYKEQVVSNEKNYVPLFTAISEGGSSNTTLELLLTSYTSCGTNLASLYNSNIINMYTNFVNENNETCNVTNTENIMFGGNEAYRLDCEFVKDGNAFQYLTTIVFCVNDYFAQINIFSDSENADKTAFESARDGILEGAANTAQ